MEGRSRAATVKRSYVSIFGKMPKEISEERDLDFQIDSHFVCGQFIFFAHYKLVFSFISNYIFIFFFLRPLNCTSDPTKPGSTPKDI